MDRGLQDASTELRYRGAPNDHSGQLIVYVFIQLNHFCELNLTDGNRKVIFLLPEITIRSLIAFPWWQLKLFIWSFRGLWFRKLTASVVTSGTHYRIRAATVGLIGAMVSILMFSDAYRCKPACLLLAFIY